MKDRKKPLKAIPAHSKTVEFDPKEFGFTLAADENLLLVLEKIEAKTIKAAQKPHKFAWR